jgi:hypothetical protein
MNTAGSVRIIPALSRQCRIALPRLNSCPFTGMTSGFVLNIKRSSFPMTRRISNLSVILSFFATVTAIYLGPVIVEAEESQGDLKSHTAVSHLLDGKKFIGPTGEKGKKVHHEDILKFSGGKFTSPECFQYGFKGGLYTATIEGDAIHFQIDTA